MSNVDTVTGEQFAQLITAIVDLTPQFKPLSELAINLYYQELCAYSFEQLQQGLSGHIRSERACYRPQPGDLIKHIERASGVLDERDRALQSWGALQLALERYTPDRPPTVDALTNRIVREKLGGWRHLSTTNNKDLAFIKRDFLDLYQVGLKLKAAHENKALQNSTLKITAEQGK